MRSKPIEGTVAAARPARFGAMPLSSSLARINRRVTNRIARPLAGRIPGFAVVRHTGRRSGRVYRTPVNLFRSRGRYVIALTYGSDRDWVKNVLAAGGCEIETRGEIVRLTDARIVRDGAISHVPPPIRPLLKALGVTEFMELTTKASR
jgi:deazaflavin-dependent oxidoreductase (nitroreductase family)